MKKLFTIFMAALFCIPILGSEDQGELIKQQRRERAEEKKQELLHKLARKPAYIFEPIIGSEPAIREDFSTVIHIWQPDIRREMEKEIIDKK